MDNCFVTPFTFSIYMLSYILYTFKYKLLLFYIVNINLDLPIYLPSLFSVPCCSLSLSGIIFLLLEEYIRISFSACHLVASSFPFLKKCLYLAFIFFTLHCWRKFVLSIEVHLERNCGSLGCGGHRGRSWPILRAPALPLPPRPWVPCLPATLLPPPLPHIDSTIPACTRWLRNDWGQHQ